MTTLRLLILVLVITLVTMACGVTFNLPLTEIKTGPTKIEDIAVPALSDQTQVAEVKLIFGAGELDISSGDDEALISGQARYNVEDLKPQINIRGEDIEIRTGDLELNAIPRFDGEFVNEWDLKFNNEMPMELEISAGAYQGRFDLGGLAIEELSISDGAADVRVEFSEPNIGEMRTFRYETGASKVRLNDLANANFSNLVFKGGAGDYTLDFSGDLVRDANVTIDAGLSSVALIVPDGVSARVFVDRGLANIDIQGDWRKSGDDYYLEGDGPVLTINVNIGAGNLDLRNR
ncbi:MAG: hypothetical protein JSV61_12820 [Anaerolineales bacterium]|nr:MAG: hypothetical protein JSV61_12820 [Anaerolineales bacterium]